MIRTLQKKFIVTAMTAVTVLLAVLLGAINIANAFSLSRQSDQLLLSLAMQEGFGPAPAFEPGGRDPGIRDPESERRGFWTEPMTEDRQMSALYFTVRLDSDGQVLETNLRRIASVDEETAEALALQAIDSKGYGRIGNYRFQIVEPADDSRTVVFLDVSSQRHAVLRMAALSALAGLLAWGAMLALVAALSRRAICPIAENMERQRRFVTDAGHELKTPLAVMQANLDAMELREGENKYSRNIRAQIARLGGLTQNLLTLARIDESGRPAQLSELSLTELAGEALEAFRSGAEQKNIAVSAALSPGVTVRADRAQIAQLLSLLLDNAVKYCPEGGRIHMTLAREGKAVLRLSNSVDDAQIDTERIFDRFYRADASRSRQTGGFGIGLSAARAVAELHGGSLRADYEGAGTLVFTVTLP